MTYFTKLARTVALAALMVGAGAAQAAGAGLRIGTTGVGADFGWEIAPTLGGRIGVSGGSYSTDVDTDDVRYDAKLKLGNFNAFLDWSPLGPFRLTGGVIANNNKIDLHGVPKGAAAYGSLDGTVKSGHSVAPYLGIGYGNVWTKGVNFYFDLGVMFMGSPKVSLTANCTVPATCAAAQSQVEAERRKVEDELKKFQYFPVANIGITIGF